MSNNYKDDLVSNLKNKIKDVGISIETELNSLKQNEEPLLLAVRRASSNEQEIATERLIYVRRRIEELSELYDSPFFAKIVYNVDGTSKEIYISKYEFTSSGVVSWTSPIASLRFKTLGDNSVKINDDFTREVFLTQKDNYVINRDKIIYYSEESLDKGVEIIYEDFLQNIKTEYGLSEIISKIEAEQYKIIQSKYNIPLIVSGPAGSGKTTICLHRVSYLIQTPETAMIYAGIDMLMLVQDKSTKDYFSSIMPKLGIRNMFVYTYFEWGLYVLGLDELSDMKEIDLNEIDENYLKILKDKNKILIKGKLPKREFGAPILFELDKLYKKNLTEENYIAFQKLSRNNEYDYLDITIMLNMMTNDDGLCVEEEIYKSTQGGKQKLVKRRRPIKYGLIMVDEFQNYSNDQLNIINRTIDAKTNSLVYIGDPNQRSMIKPSTDRYDNLIDNFDRISLDKVYRNTRNILEFIKNQGYDVIIPDKARMGNEVNKINCASVEELKNHIHKIINEIGDETVGILFDNNKIMNNINIKLPADKNVRIMTKIESQGTEFATVICVNQIEGEDNINSNSSEFINLKRQIKRNSNYIGYTRAVDNLYVLEV